MPRWSVDIIRKRAEHLGTVEAANANEAIKIAAKEFDIPPERQNRTVVEKQEQGLALMVSEATYFVSPGDLYDH